MSPNRRPLNMQGGREVFCLENPRGLCRLQWAKGGKEAMGAE